MRAAHDNTRDAQSEHNSAELRVLSLFQQVPQYAKWWAIAYQLAVVLCVIEFILTLSRAAQRFVLGDNGAALYGVMLCLLYVPVGRALWRVRRGALVCCILLYLAYCVEPWLFHILPVKVSHKDILKCAVLVAGTVGCFRIHSLLKRNARSDYA